MKNEKEWFSENIHNCQPGLYYLAFSILKNEEDAKDAIQDTLYKAYSKLDTLKDSKKFKPWIMQILHNTALELLQKRKKTVSIENREETADIQSDTDAVMRMTVWSCVQALEEQYRTIVVLFYYEDLSVREIARITGLKPDAVKKRLSRAREQLKKQLTETEVN